MYAHDLEIFMAVSDEKDLLLYELRCDLEGNIGGQDVAEMERFLKNHASELDITGIKRLQPQLKPSFNDSDVMLEFRIAKMMEGPKVTCRPHLKPHFEQQQEKVNSLQFQMDLTGTGIKDQNLAIAMISAFVELLLKTALRLQPSNSTLSLHLETGNEELDKLANKILEEKLEEYGDKFREKGIVVAVHDKETKKDRIVVSPIPELEDTNLTLEQQKAQKPWSVPKVPHGAPDLLPPKGKR